MWIHLNNAFLSAVAHRTQPDMLLVRARVAGDIERVFPGVSVQCTPQADYRYRATIPREVVAKAIADQIEAIPYDNFKNSVREPDRHDAYFESWRAMHRLQTDRARS